MDEDKLIGHFLEEKSKSDFYVDTFHNIQTLFMVFAIKKWALEKAEIATKSSILAWISQYIIFLNLFTRELFYKLEKLNLESK